MGEKSKSGKKASEIIKGYIDGLDINEDLNKLVSDRELRVQVITDMGNPEFKFWIKFHEFLGIAYDGGEYPPVQELVTAKTNMKVEEGDIIKLFGSRKTSKIEISSGLKIVPKKGMDDDRGSEEPGGNILAVEKGNQEVKIITSGRRSKDEVRIYNIIVIEKFPVKSIKGKYLVRKGETLEISTSYTDSMGEDVEVKVSNGLKIIDTVDTNFERSMRGGKTNKKYTILAVKKGFHNIKIIKTYECGPSDDIEIYQVEVI